MKTVSTQYTDNAEIDFLTLLSLLKNLRDEEFIVLVDENDRNYIQATFEDEDNPDSDYLVEMRIYHGDDFSHYRKVRDDFDQVIKDFDAFYHNAKDYDFRLASWQNVTEEFIDTLTLDSRLSGESYDAYIATLDSVMDSVDYLAETGDFVHIFDDTQQITTCSLAIYPNFKADKTSYDVKFKDKVGDIYTQNFDNIEFISQIVNDFLQYQIVDTNRWHKLQKEK